MASTARDMLATGAKQARNPLQNFLTSENYHNILKQLKGHHMIEKAKAFEPFGPFLRHTSQHKLEC